VRAAAWGRGAIVASTLLAAPVAGVVPASAQSDDAPGVEIDTPATEVRAPFEGDGGGDHLAPLALAGVALLTLGITVLVFHRRRREAIAAEWPDAPTSTPTDRRAHPDSTIDLFAPFTTAPAAPRPTAIAFVEPRDATMVHEALARDGVTADEVSDAATAFAAVVRGSTLLVVDASRPDAEDLLRSVRRRIDDGWSDCAVVAYFPPWVTVDVELSPLIDGVARYPITASDLDLAIRVARSQSDDRRGHTSVVRSPQAGPVPQSH
jgi:hypothetical protein